MRYSVAIYDPKTRRLLHGSPALTKQAMRITRELAERAGYIVKAWKGTRQIFS